MSRDSPYKKRLTGSKQSNKSDLIAAKRSIHRIIDKFVTGQQNRLEFLAKDAGFTDLESNGESSVVFSPSVCLTCQMCSKEDPFQICLNSFTERLPKMRMTCRKRLEDHVKFRHTVFHGSTDASTEGQAQVLSTLLACFPEIEKIAAEDIANLHEQGEFHGSLEVAGPSLGSIVDQNFSEDVVSFMTMFMNNSINRRNETAGENVVKDNEEHSMDSIEFKDEAEEVSDRPICSLPGIETEVVVKEEIDDESRRGFITCALNVLYWLAIFFLQIMYIVSSYSYCQAIIMTNYNFYLTHLHVCVVLIYIFCIFKYLNGFIFCYS